MVALFIKNSYISFKYIYVKKKKERLSSAFSHRPYILHTKHCFFFLHSTLFFFWLFFYFNVYNLEKFEMQDEYWLLLMYVCVCVRKFWNEKKNAQHCFAGKFYFSISIPYSVHHILFLTLVVLFFSVYIFTVLYTFVSFLEMYIWHLYRIIIY